MSGELKKTDATTNLVEFCLKNSLPEPIFQTNDSGWVLAKVGKFEFLAKKSKHGRSMVSWNTRNNNFQQLKTFSIPNSYFMQEFCKLKFKMGFPNMKNQKSYREISCTHTFAILSPNRHGNIVKC